MPPATIAATFALFIIVYAIVFAMGIYYINRLIMRGPEDSGGEPHTAMPSIQPQLPGTEIEREVVLDHW